MGTPSGTIQTADVAVDMYMESHGGTSCTWIHGGNSFRHPRTAKPTVGRGVRRSPPGVVPMPTDEPTFHTIVSHGVSAYSPQTG